PGILDENRQTRDVICVNVREEHVPHQFLVAWQSGETEATGIDCDGVVDQIGRHILPMRAIDQRRAERAYFHAGASTARSSPCSNHVSTSPLPFTLTRPRLSKSKRPFSCS